MRGLLRSGPCILEWLIRLHFLDGRLGGGKLGGDVVFVITLYECVLCFVVGDMFVYGIPCFVDDIDCLFVYRSYC